jgi:crossover junction endodeoxyribonuclease RuvC
LTRALGVDPGTATTGFGVVEEDGHGLRAVEYGAILTPADTPMPQRLRLIYCRLLEIFERHRPEAVSVERLFFSRNVTTAISVGQARGVALLAAACSDLAVFEYTPLEVKQAVTGFGRATKDQVQQMVRLMLQLDEIPKPDDAADALAIAICHLQSAQMRALIARAE